MTRPIVSFLLVCLAAAGCAGLNPFTENRSKAKRMPLWAPFASEFAKPEPAYQPEAFNDRLGIGLTLPNDRWRAIKDAPVVGVPDDRYDGTVAIYAFNKRDQADLRIFAAPDTAGTPAFIAARAAREIPDYLVSYTPVVISPDGSQAKFIYKNAGETRLFLVKRYPRSKPLTLVIYGFWSYRSDEVVKDINSIVASIKVEDLPAATKP